MNSSSIFQQNSRTMLGMKSFTPDRASNKKVIEFNHQNEMNNSMNHSISTNSSTNIFFKPYQLELTQSQPKQVSSDRCITVNLNKMLNSQDVKKSAFFNGPKKQMPQFEKQDIIDWVSGNNSMKFEDIMKTPVQTIKLSAQSNNNSFNINNNYSYNKISNNNNSSQIINNTNDTSQQDMSKIASELGDVDMTSSIVVNRRTRRNIPKSLDENSFLSVQSPTNNAKNQQQNTNVNSPKNYQVDSQLSSSKNISIFNQKYQQESSQQKVNETKIVKQIQSKSQPSSIEKIYDEFLQNSSEPTLSKIENDQGNNSKSKIIRIKNPFEDRNSSLGDIFPQQQSTQSNNKNYNIPDSKINSRRKINFTKFDKIDDNFESNSTYKTMTDGDIDDFISTRPHSNTFDVNESKRTTSPSTTSSLSKNSLYKSILKQPKEKTIDFFGDLVDATKSPSNKKVQFAEK